jgi:hypothetical protein
MSYPKRSVAQLVFSATGWVLAGLLGLAGGLAIPAVILLGQGWRLDGAGVEVTGQVTRLWLDNAMCAQSPSQSCTYDMVDYVYEAAGATLQGQESVSGPFYAGLHQGGPVQVRYVAQDPGTSEIEIGLTLIGAVFLALLALAIGGAGAFGLWRRLRMARGMVQMRDTGVMRRAMVTSLVPSRIRVNNRQQWVMRWTDSAGAEGRSRMRGVEDLPAAGSEITVYADPAARVPPVWEGDCGTR